MMLSHRMDYIARLSVIPASAVLAASASATKAAQPMGPFCCGDRRMELLDNSLNFLFASTFQVVLIAFLLFIGLHGIRRSPSGLPRVPATLTVILLAIYVLSGICMAILSTGGEWPDFGTLVRLGFVIIGLSWAGVVVSIRRKGHARRQRRT